MVNPSNPSHGHFLLLLRVTGVEGLAIQSEAQAIHNAYMAEYEGRGALTEELLELTHVIDSGTNQQQPTAWNFVMRYFGPTESVAGLQSQLEAAASRLGGAVTTQTYSVRNITGRY
jgi:hypothetical protein